MWEKNKLKLGAVVTVGAFVLAGCAGADADADGAAGVSTEDQVTEITVGITPIANAAHLYIAIEEGFFEEEGLEVTPSTIQATSTAVPSLMNDELQVALMNSIPVVTAASKNLPITVISGSDRYSTDATLDTTALVVSPESDIAEVADLAGKTVAVVGLKSGPDLALHVVLEEAGVDVNDVEIVEISYPDMMPALESDRIDAAFLVDPFLSIAKGEEFQTISQPFTEGLGGMSALQWVSSENFVESNPDTVRKFNTAIAKAGEFANDNPDKIRGVLPEFTSLSEEAINNAVLPFYDATVSQQDLQDHANLMGEHGFIDEGYVVDGLLWSDDDR